VLLRLDVVELFPDCLLKPTKRCSALRMNQTPVDAFADNSEVWGYR
jgi:hypothetical protein